MKEMIKKLRNNSNGAILRDENLREILFDFNLVSFHFLFAS